MTRQDMIDTVIAAAQAAGLPPSALLAVVEIESAWRALEDDGITPRLLFERHVFYRELKARAPDKLGAAVAAGLANQKWSRNTQYKDQASSAGRLALVARARQIDEECANRSCSWGLGQTMGFLADELGYTSATSMLMTMTAGGVRAQVGMMVAEIRRKGLADDLTRGDWAGFARGYNGSGYEANAYDTKLAAAARSWEARLARTPGDVVRGTDTAADVQRTLMTLGYDIGPAGADGIAGRATKEAIRAFQRDHHLIVDGIAGPDTRSALTQALRGNLTVPAGASTSATDSAPVDTRADVPAAPEPAPPTEEVVATVQRRLRELGWSDVGEVDGLWGDRTRGAVLAYRAAQDLPLIPRIDSELLVSLAGAAPREVAPARAGATLAEVAAKVPAVAAARAARVLSAGTAVATSAGAVLVGMADNIGTATDRLSPLKLLVGAVPGWVWIGAVAGVAVMLWRASRRAESAGVQDYRDARTL